jgi:hypothetical protein
MRDLKMNEIEEVNGGISVSTVKTLMYLAYLVGKYS